MAVWKQASVHSAGLNSEGLEAGALGAGALGVGEGRMNAEGSLSPVVIDERMPELDCACKIECPKAF